MSNEIDNEIISWFGSIRKSLSILGEKRKKNSALLAPDFNVLRYARTDEFGLSRIIADLLNPSGPHGQGDRFLVGFLDINWPERPAIGKSVTVRTEVPTIRIENNRRRIDILVDFDSGLLAIENKPWAADQENQIIDYLRHLQNCGKPYRLIYLSGQPGRTPSGHSRDKIFLNTKATSYPELSGWLELCKSQSDNDRVSFFLHDLQDFVARRFLHQIDDSETALIVEFAMSSSEGVRAALALSSVTRDLRIYLLERLKQQLLETFETAAADSGISGWKMSIPQRLDQKYASVRLERRSDSALFVAMQFEDSRCSNCFYGVGRRTDADRSDHEVIHNALQNGFGFGEHFDWWTWSNWSETRYWWYERRIWTGIVDGTLAHAIVEHLIDMVRVLDTAEIIPLFEVISAGNWSQMSKVPPWKISDTVKTFFDDMDEHDVNHLFAIEAAEGPLRLKIRA